MEQKIQKKFFVFQIIAFELAVANCGNSEQDTCNWRSIRQQTPLRFDLTLGETFSKSTSLRIMEKHDKTAVMEILQAFWILSHADCQSMFRNGDFYGRV